MALKSIYRDEWREALDVLRQVRLRATGPKGKPLTQTEFAERIGRSQSFTSAVERGSVRIDIVQLMDWLAASGTSAEEWGRLMDAAMATHQKPKPKTKAKAAPKPKTKHTAPE